LNNERCTDEDDCQAADIVAQVHPKPYSTQLSLTGYVIVNDNNADICM